METGNFQNFLLKSALAIIACDGRAEQKEIDEINRIASNEIYFMGYEYQEALNDNLAYIKANGRKAIDEYLSEISLINLTDKQELILIEVLLRVMEADEKIEQNEIKFLQMVKSKLKINEETLIIKFPKQISYLIDFHHYSLHEAFTDEIEFEQ